MTGTFGSSEAVELAVVERSGFVESRHAGSAVVLGPDGEVIRAVGPVSAAIFPRSCLKPIQAVALMTAGITLRGEDAVIAASSHSGTAGHVALVRALLARAGLDENALECPATYPSDRAARDQLARSGGSPARVYMDCSGKHAAMLYCCTANGWPVEGYLDLRHPVQRRIVEIVERLTGERPAAIGIDGCGAPIHAVSLQALARGFQRVATSQPSSPFALFREAGALAEAVRENAWVIAGPGQPDSIVIERLGVFAKSGAEGVLAMTAQNGTTVALKVLDGSSRAATAVGLRLLAAADALDQTAVDEVTRELDLWITGGNARVGAIRATI